MLRLNPKDHSETNPAVGDKPVVVEGRYGGTWRLENVKGAWPTAMPGGFAGSKLTLWAGRDSTGPSSAVVVSSRWGVEEWIHVYFGAGRKSVAITEEWVTVSFDGDMVGKARYLFEAEEAARVKTALALTPAGTYRTTLDPNDFEKAFGPYRVREVKTPFAPRKKYWWQR